MAPPRDSNISVTELPISSSQKALSTFLSNLALSSGEFSVVILVTATGAPSVSITPVSFSSGASTIAETPQNTHAAAYTSSAVPVESGQLRAGQAGGIALAGLASTSIVFGLLLFICCLRRGRVSREQRRQISSKTEERPPKMDRAYNPSVPPTPPPKDDAGTGDGGTTGKATSRTVQNCRMGPNNSIWAHGMSDLSRWSGTSKGDFLPEQPVYSGQLPVAVGCNSVAIFHPPQAQLPSQRYAAESLGWRPQQQSVIQSTAPLHYPRQQSNSPLRPNYI